MILPLYAIWTGEYSEFQIGPITLRLYSLMFVAAFLLGFQLMKRMYITDKSDIKHLDELFMFTFIGTVIGARLGHVIFYEPEMIKEDFINVFLPISFNNGIHFTGFRGLASHGAAIAIPITTYLFVRYKQKIPFLWVADRLSITVALAGFFIRFGNFFNSEIIGKPSNSSIAILFSNQSLSYGPIVPRHPTQIYEAISYLILFIILWAIYQKTEKKNYLGWIFGFFTIMLWSIRFTIEFYKEPQGDSEALSNWFNIGINNGQLLSIPFILLGIVMLLTSKNRYYKHG